MAEGEWLLATIQYLVFADLLLGIASAIKTKTFDPARFGKGIRKVISVCLSLLIVGVGTHAVDEATGGIVIFGVRRATLYAFLCCISSPTNSSASTGI